MENSNEELYAELHHLRLMIKLKDDHIKMYENLVKDLKEELLILEDLIKDLKEELLILEEKLKENIVF